MSELPWDSQAADAQQPNILKSQKRKQISSKEREAFCDASHKIIELAATSGFCLKIQYQQNDVPKSLISWLPHQTLTLETHLCLKTL